MIVAFTDSDCMADRDWLYFLVSVPALRRFRRGGRAQHLAAGDQLDPRHRGRGARLAQPRAAHRHHRRARAGLQHGLSQVGALDEIGGFDIEYRKAGDDVDVCWRLMQRGYVIGFSPAAVVWHYRRFAVGTYFSQQTGYGEAEAMLRYKHLQYFGPTGSAIWHGNVYSQVRMDSFFTKPIIYHGVFGTGLFQCIYPKALFAVRGVAGQPRVAGGDALRFLPVDPAGAAAAHPAHHVRPDPRSSGLTLHGAGAHRDQVRQHRRAAPVALSRHRAAVAPRLGALLHLAARQAHAPRRHRGQGGCAAPHRQLGRLRQPRVLERDRPRTHAPARHHATSCSTRRAGNFPSIPAGRTGTCTSSPAAGGTCASAP